jgi:hypothetical protein
MTTFKWVVSQMDTAPSEDRLTDVVKTVHWRRDAKEIDGDKTYYGDVYGAMGCAAPDPMAFKPYNELTFEEVCGWLEGSLDVEALDTSLDAQIENQINPPIVNLPLPWSTTTSTTTKVVSK